MNRALALTAVLLALCVSAHGAVFTYAGPFANSGVIPDNDPIGLTDAHAISGLASSISDVVLTVHLSGSFITDLSGYIRLGNLTGSPTVDLSPTLALGSGDFTLDLAAFNSLNPNNTWTIFFADTVPAGENSLTSWSLNITAVPEPVNTALIVLGALAVAAKLISRWRKAALAPAVTAETSR